MRGITEELELAIRQRSRNTGSDLFWCRVDIWSEGNSGFGASDVGGIYLMYIASLLLFSLPPDNTFTSNDHKSQRMAPGPPTHPHDS
jgi:hypothetical protein